MLYPAELLAQIMERVMGIEPTRPAWKAGILAIELHPHKIGTSLTDFKIISALTVFVKAFFVKKFGKVWKLFCYHSEVAEARSFAGASSPALPIR